jgi:signal transduction histidine kinase
MTEDKEQVRHLNTELLSIVSHQMRSPLAAMKGFITLITDGAYGDINDNVRAALSKVQSSADGLISLIDTVLDVRRVDEGRMEYIFEKIDLVPLIADIVDSIMPLAKEKDLSLTVDCAPVPMLVRADQGKLRLAIHNLIDNGIKYTPKGFVKVTLAAEQGSALITVSDSGYGIPAALIPHLFNEFIRDERIKKEVRGTGLGLYIARKIVEAHSGILTAESPGEGRGSTFEIIIPTII